MWKCPTCSVNEKRLSGSIRDASTNRYARITMRRTNENGQEVLKIYISGVSRAENENDPNFSLPLLNELTLIKQ